MCALGAVPLTGGDHCEYWTQAAHMEPSVAAITQQHACSVVAALANFTSCVLAGFTVTAVAAAAAAAVAVVDRQL